jgi:hypothetical protein
MDTIITSPPIEKPINRYYYKCPICLSVGAHEYHKKIEILCDLCNEKMECMGMVHDNHLVEIDMRSPCDARCTNAFGPSCDCHCHGENHGTGLIVPVFVVVGEIPKMKTADATAYFRRKEYLKADEEARKRLEETIAKLNLVDPTSWSTKNKIMTARNLYKHTTELKVHATRMKKLVRLFL